LVDALHVPKLLSEQLLSFGSVDFRGRAVFSSVRAWRTVREGQADSPRIQCSSRVLRVLARLRFRSVLVLSFGWKWFRTVRSSGRTVRGCLADSPRAPRGQSVFRGSLLEVLLALTDSPRPRPDGPLYRGTLADGPRGPCGQSASPGRTVRQSLAALLFGSIPPSFFRVSACASSNRS
jgi:hypothetical protein